MTAPARKRIGRYSDVATRQIVYQTEDALEVDEIDHFEIVRKRVYFDDILLMTMHSHVGVAFVVTMAVFFALLAAIAVAFQSAHEPEWAGWFAGFSAPFLLALFARVLLKQEVITIYGRRSKAGLRFTFRKTYAHAKFEEIRQLAFAAQQRLESVQQSMEPPIAPELMGVPMPPPPEAVTEPPQAPDELPAEPPAPAQSTDPSEPSS
jgi:hypothetical protein